MLAQDFVPGTYHQEKCLLPPASCSSFLTYFL